MGYYARRKQREGILVSQQPAPNGNGHAGVNVGIQIDCPTCKSKFSAQLPECEILNTPTVSVVTAPHQKLTKCTSCGQAFVFFLQQIKTDWGVSVISEEQRRQIEGSEIIQLG